MPCEKVHMVQNYDNNILEGLAVATHPSKKNLKSIVSYLEGLAILVPFKSIIEVKCSLID